MEQLLLVLLSTLQTVSHITFPLVLLLEPVLRQSIIFHQAVHDKLILTKTCLFHSYLCKYHGILYSLQLPACQEMLHDRSWDGLVVEIRWCGFESQLRRSRDLIWNLCHVMVGYRGPFVVPGMEPWACSLKSHRLPLCIVVRIDSVRAFRFIFSFQVTHNAGWCLPKSQINLLCICTWFPIACVSLMDIDAWLSSSVCTEYVSLHSESLNLSLQSAPSAYLFHDILSTDSFLVICRDMLVLKNHPFS